MNYKINIGPEVFLIVALVIFMIIGGVMFYFESTTCIGWAIEKNSSFLSTKQCPQGKVEAKDDVVICSCLTE